VKRDLDEIKVSPDDTIRAAMAAIDRGGVEIALVCRGAQLVGVASDGDVRRALLAGFELDTPIGPHASHAYLAVPPEAERSAVLELMTTRQVSQVPVIADDGRLVGLHILNDLIGVRVPLSIPTLGGNTESYLRECVQTNFVSSVGPFVARFEGEFAQRVGSRFGVACASGTAALHLALLAVGVGAGDEVWVSDLTFVASANPISYCGATPVLVDSETHTWNLDPALVVAELERRAAAGDAQPAAIIVVHLLGHPADLAPILQAASTYGVPVIEDAAEALGARWVGGPLDGKEAGAVGVIGCHSFNGNKLITTGGGGMVVTDDEHLAARCRHLSTQAKLPGADYRHDEIGFNYRMTNISAALGVAQLEQLELFLERRRAIADRYDSAFRQVPAVELPPDAPWAKRSAWLYSPLFRDVEEREAVRYALSSAQIEARAIWLPVHDQRPYAGVRMLGDGSVAHAIAERALSLPCSPSLTAPEQDRVIDIVLATIGEL